MTSLGCVSVTGCRASLPLLEQVSYSRDVLVSRLPHLRASSGADQLAVLSTCERTEVYAVWSGEADLDALVRALAEDRAVSHDALDGAAGRFTGGHAVRHLFRVASGLESFVVGDTDVVGQVRVAAELSRDAAVNGLELDRLMDAAVNASRRAHRHTSFEETGRSVGTAAVEAVAELNGGSLHGKRLLVVGAGQVAAAVVARAGGLGASVTVCNRTRRRAERFIAGGATVVDLAELARCLSEVDVAILSTAAPHLLVDRAMVVAARAGRPDPLLLLDLCLPRNVDPQVRSIAQVQLVDLDDLRALDRSPLATLTEDAALAGRLVEEEVDRFQRWLAARPAAEAVRRMRADVDVIVRAELESVRRSLPDGVFEPVESALLRAVRKLIHGPTAALLDAVQAGDPEVTALLTGLFARAPARSTAPVPGRAAR